MSQKGNLLAASEGRRATMRDADIKKIIRTKGLWATPRRMLVFKILHMEAIPLPVEVIAAKLKRKVDMVTVYRTLKAFKQHGIVEKVNVRKDREYYELASFGEEHHHHLVCDSCGVVEDVEVPEPKDMEKNILKQSKNFGAITSHSLEFFGKCKVCVNA